MLLRDGRRARLRPVELEDAERLLALDFALAEDGRGMVLCPDQVRSVVAERERLGELLERIEVGSSSRTLVAELIEQEREVPGVELTRERSPLLGSAGLTQLGMALCTHVGLLSVGVHPSAQRQGVGRALMDALIEHARAGGQLERLELYVRADNERAQALYRSLGFEHEATRARFVKLADWSYVDDFVMCRFLTRER